MFNFAGNMQFMYQLLYLYSYIPCLRLVLYFSQIIFQNIRVFHLIVLTGFCLAVIHAVQTLYAVGLTVVALMPSSSSSTR